MLGKWGIFVSYRREQSADAANRIYSLLSQEFGAYGVYKDPHKLSLGGDFPITDAINRCKILVAVIGSDWLDARDKAGARRLDDPRDYVRLENELAAAQKLAIIPVLVQGAAMPADKDLPSALAILGKHQPVVVSESRFSEDLQALVTRVKQILPAELTLSIPGRWRGSSLIMRPDRTLERPENGELYTPATFTVEEDSSYTFTPNVSINDTQLTGLDPLRRVHRLMLDFSECYNLTDIGLAYLRSFTNISALDLSRCKQLTDAGMTHLTSLANLRSLSLAGCVRLTDLALTQLASATSLASLNLRYCDKLSEAGLQGLRAALPHCAIQPEPPPSEKPKTKKPQKPRKL